MKLIFWLSFAVLAWCYAAYPIAMLLRARFRPRRLAPAKGAGPCPVSVVIATRNGAKQIQRRLDDLFAATYPPALLEAIVVCNGCSDDTEAIAREYGRRDPRVRVLVTPADEGKAGALNAGVAAAEAEIVVFADMRQTFHPEAIARLVQPFADPTVGAVSGRLVLGAGNHPAVEGVRWYWSLETALRHAESRTGSMIGVTGAISAVRRSAFSRIPPGLILDDVYVPMRAVLRGLRVVFADEAVAFDVSSLSGRHEYYRKRRTMVGNIQLVRVLPTLLSPRRNPAFIRFVSHKMLRLGTPVFCIGLIAAAAALPGPLYGSVFWLGVLGYAGGVLGLIAPNRWLNIPAAFILVHIAILAALARAHQDAGDVWSEAESAGQPVQPVVSGETPVP